MQVVRDDDEEAGPKVNLETWVRNEGKLYQLSLRLSVLLNPLYRLI